MERLATNDGKPARNKYLPYSRQWIDDEDIKSVVEVLRSDRITQGPKVKELEEAVAEFVGTNYAIMLSSGTAALHAACFATGISKGDEVITSPITFSSTANAVLFLHAHPVFVDIEKDTGNIDPRLIEKAITEKTRAIIPVDYGGHSIDLENIARIAGKHSLVLIEDACHALGAEYKGERIGSCKYSDIAIFSLHPVKSITAGEGGILLTNNKEYYEKLIMFREHGITRDKAKFEIDPVSVPGDWYYEMQFLGYNYRLTDIQCALGISQLKKLEKFIQRRREIVEIYREAFKNNEFFDLPVEKNYAKSSWHLYSIKLKDKYKSRKGKVFAKLREKGLGVQVHYIPVYWQPYYQKLGYGKGSCPDAEDFYQREISIPLYQSMGGQDVKYVIDAIMETFREI